LFRSLRARAPENPWGKQNRDPTARVDLGASGQLSWVRLSIAARAPKRLVDDPGSFKPAIRDEIAPRAGTGQVCSLAWESARAVLRRCRTGDAGQRLGIRASPRGLASVFRLRLCRGRRRP